MSAQEQILLPGAATPPPRRKARVFRSGRLWIVDIPTPFGRAIRYETATFQGAIRFLEQVTRRRRRHA